MESNEQQQRRELQQRITVDLNVPAPPFDYNPSSWGQRIPIAVIASLGVLISVYLSLYEWGLISTVWDPVFGEQSAAVLKSDVAKTMHYWFVIPDAALGAVAYLGDAVLGLAGGTRRWQHRPWMVILFGIDVIPLGIVSAVLVALQGTVVGAWCFLCIVTAIISLTLVFYAYDEVWASITFLYRVWKRTRSKKLLWKAFIGVPFPESDEIALSGSKPKRQSQLATPAVGSRRQAAQG